MTQEFVIYGLGLVGLYVVAAWVLRWFWRVIQAARSWFRVAEPIVRRHWSEEDAEHAYERELLKAFSERQSTKLRT